jgi:hypothetical protein
VKILIAQFMILTSVLNFNAYGQSTDHEHEEHKHHIGFLIGSVYNLTEERNLLGLGFEYEYVLPFWNRLFGIGLASEVVFDEHKHYVFSLLVPVHLTREISLFVAPGIMFIEQDEIETRFAIHFGAEYEFDLKKYFIAPEFEIAFAGDDIHIMLGIHIGFGI